MLACTPVRTYDIIFVSEVVAILIFVKEFYTTSIATSKLCCVVKKVKRGDCSTIYAACIYENNRVWVVQMCVDIVRAMW